MKTAVAILASVWLSISAFGQGTVAFSNLGLSNFRLWTNTFTPSGSNFMSGVNAYRIGLYVGPGGSTPSSLALVGLATNAPLAALAGSFNGGNPFAVPGFSQGQVIAFQIRAWSFSSGTSFESALADPFGVFGSSPMGYAALGGGTVPPAALFGPNPGQLSSGFAIGIPIPEPSTCALSVLAIVATLVGGWRKHRKSR